MNSKIFLILLGLVFLGLTSGCVNTGEGSMTVFAPKTSAGLQFGYQRGSALDTNVAESGKDLTEGEQWIDTQGGGDVDAQASGVAP